MARDLQADASLQNKSNQWIGKLNLFVSLFLFCLTERLACFPLMQLAVRTVGLMQSEIFFSSYFLLLAEGMG